MAGYLSENVRYQAVIIFGFEGHRDSLNIEAMQFEITKILEEVFLPLLSNNTGLSHQLVRTKYRSKTYVNICMASLIVP